MALIAAGISNNDTSTTTEQLIEDAKQAVQDAGYEAGEVDFEQLCMPGVIYVSIEISGGFTDAPVDTNGFIKNAYLKADILLVAAGGTVDLD